MKAEAQLTFSFDNQSEAAAFHSVLSPEAKRDKRVQTKLMLKDSSVGLTIRGADRNVFRSTVNSYARWTRLYEDIGGIE